MKSRFLLLILLIFGLNFSSFSQHFHLTKRQYRKGYYLQNKQKVKSDNEIINANAEPAKEKMQVSDENNSKHKNDNVEKVVPRLFNNLIASIDSTMIYVVPQNNHSNSASNENINVAPTKSIKHLEKIKSRISRFQQMLGKNSEPTVSGGAVAGMVLGIIGLFLFGLILGVISLIISAVALAKILKDPTTYKGKGMAIAGIILGVIDIVGWIFAMMLLLGAL